MTTAAELIEKARNDYILAGHYEERNRLAGTIAAGDETLTLAFDAGGIVRGARVSIGLEDMYVWSADGTTADVDRGQYGTTAAAHTQGDVVFVNPRPSPAAVLRAMNTTVNNLSNLGIFKVSYVDITTDGSASAYNLDVDDYISPLDVRMQMDGPTEDWPILVHWQVADEVPTDEFAAGRALRIFEAVPSGRTLRFRYKAALNPGLTALDDVVETVTGLESWAVHVLPLGAAVHLVAGREIARSRDDRQGDTRRSDEVPPNANLLSMRGVLALYEGEVAGIERRLNITYPTRMRAAR